MFIYKLIGRYAKVDVRPFGETVCYCAIIQFCFFFFCFVFLPLSKLNSIALTLLSNRGRKASNAIYVTFDVLKKSQEDS